MEKILNNTLCLTHGGSLAGLYGILATDRLSSNNALLKQGDETLKFTDPNNEFTQENNFLFFESIVDRGNLKYASFVENKSNQVGFSFLLVASSQSLLNQVDMVGNSDGILLGRSDDTPLEINIKQLDYKILIPESYKTDVKNYCEELRKLGHNAPEDLLIFKPIEELTDLLSSKISDPYLERQQTLCDIIQLNANISDKNFAISTKEIETKTSIITTSCSMALSTKAIKQKEFNTAEDLVSHMRERPTLSNLQRNTMLLFAEKSNSSLQQKISSISNEKPLIFDIIDKPEDLAFCLNNLAKLHPSKEVLESGEKRIDSFECMSIINKINNAIESPNTKKGLIECLQIARRRDISQEECANIMNECRKDKEWFVAVNRVQQPKLNTDQIQELIKNDINNEVVVWKDGMLNWQNAREMIDFKPLNKISILENIASMKPELEESPKISKAHTHAYK